MGMEVGERVLDKLKKEIVESSADKIKFWEETALNAC